MQNARWQAHLAAELVAGDQVAGNELIPTALLQDVGSGDEPALLRDRKKAAGAQGSDEVVLDGPGVQGDARRPEQRFEFAAECADRVVDIHRPTLARGAAASSALD